MKGFLLAALVTLLAMTTVAPAGIAGMRHVESDHSVSVTADRLEGILTEKGMRIFLRLNHAQGAQTAGIDLRPTELIIFGNPKVGAPLMAEQQTVGIDLPQKMLIWQDVDGKVWLTYNDPDDLALRHGLPGDMAPLLKVKQALAAIAQAAGAP